MGEAEEGVGGRTKDKKEMGRRERKEGVGEVGRIRGRREDGRRV